MRPGFMYQAGVAAYREAIRVAALWNSKARLALNGRQAWEQHLQQKVQQLEPGKRLWIHCASLGEFEQGRPVIEAVRRAFPGVRIILTFFSPSGYEVRKAYPGADIVCYLPFDTPVSAKNFLDQIRPDLAVFIKYELWLNYLHELRERNIPHFLVSALMRANSPYFTSALKDAYREAFAGFSKIMVQDTATATHLQRFTGRTDVMVAGDTRYDRVAALAAAAEEVPYIREFISNRICVVAGSAWPADEANILPLLGKFPADRMCWLIAPHEIHHPRIDKIIREYPGTMARYSRPEEIGPDMKVLWIDNIGMLNRLYRYAAFAYIGGGFGKGIHNTLEAVAYGTPVVFGPNYQRFEEAVELIREGYARCIHHSGDLEAVLTGVLEGQSQFRTGAGAFVRDRCGATEMVMKEIAGYLA